MTNRAEILERSVIRSSVMPSLKYSCSASPLILVKGSTAIDGFCGTAVSRAASSPAPFHPAAPPPPAYDLVPLLAPLLPPLPPPRDPVPAGAVLAAAARGPRHPR